MWYYERKSKTCHRVSHVGGVSFGSFQSLNVRAWVVMFTNPLLISVDASDTDAHGSQTSMAHKRKIINNVKSNGFITKFNVN